MRVTLIHMTFEEAGREEQVMEEVFPGSVSKAVKKLRITGEQACHLKRHGKIKLIDEANQCSVTIEVLEHHG